MAAGKQEFETIHFLKSENVKDFKQEQTIRFKSNPAGNSRMCLIYPIEEHNEIPAWDGN